MKDDTYFQPNMPVPDFYASNYAALTALASITVPLWLILVPCAHHPGDVCAETFHTRAACVAEATKLHLSTHACLWATGAVR